MQAPGASGINGLPGTFTGNQFLIPLIGGSGGSGAATRAANNCFGGGGGAGGGAILIASSASITVTSPGTIRAAGGAGGTTFDPSFGSRTGGDGSGGAIRLMSQLIQGNGNINAGTTGRVRLEAYQESFAGSTSPTPTAILASPTVLAPVLPSGPPPAIKVVSLGTALGVVPFPVNPGGSFSIPDATINQNTPVTINIQARNIPLSTILTLYVVSESGPDIGPISSTPLTGTLLNSTATATVTFPSAFSRGYVRGTW